MLQSIGPDLPYLTGYRAMASERLTMLVLAAEGVATLFVPQLEAPRVPKGPFRLQPWAETEDPLSLVVELVGNPSVTTVDDQLWSVFLLALQDRLPSTKCVSSTPIMRTLRIRKEPEEVRALRAAGEAADRVVSWLRNERFSGRHEQELAQAVRQAIVQHGHDEAAFAIVASGPNGASPHHEAAGRVMEKGDLVVVDFGGTVRGYRSDCTRTFAIGAPSRQQVEVHEAVQRAQASAAAAVRPGVAAEAVDAAARQVIEDAGYGEYFIHRTGHGIGLEIHEHPYLVAGNTELLETGMCFSIEPGIYLPGRFGVRIEDIVTVTDDGVQALNQADRSLHVVR